MAYNVKRFITSCLLLTILSIVVIGPARWVKPVFADIVMDEVIEIHPPFEVTLKKTGPVRLSGLLFQGGNQHITDYLVSGDKVRVDLVSTQKDRYGRKVADLYLKDHRWLQGLLVANGHAIAYPYEGETRYIRDLYQLRPPISLAALKPALIKPDQVAIVEGLVIAVAHVKNMTYLNFGENWRTDFTIRLSPKTKALFYRHGLDPDTMKGKTIRIRGWVIDENGPMMMPTTPYQIEIIKN